MEPTFDPAAIEKIGFFRGLSPSDLQQTAGAARRKSLKRDRFFFRQEDEAEAFYLLLEGRVKLLQETPDGQEVLIRLIGPGEMFGGVAMLGESTYPVSAQASEDCAALAWTRREISWLLDRYPKITRNVLKHMAGRLREIQDRYRELATERVERRVARALLRLVRVSGRKTDRGVLIDMRLSRQDLAEMSGTTLYTISRLLGAWEKAGIVEGGRMRLLICNPHGLVSIAEDLQAAD
jgi:CRP-like cAMP-binding protein